MLELRHIHLHGGFVTSSAILDDDFGAAVTIGVIEPRQDRDEPAGTMSPLVYCVVIGQDTPTLNNQEIPILGRSVLRLATRNQIGVLGMISAPGRGPRFRFVGLLALAVSCATAGSVADKPTAAVDFNRQIRPLLTKHCFRCHGQDEGHREAELRLDVRQSAVDELGSGTTAIQPGNPAESELYRRITHSDVDLRMPPAETGTQLSEDEIRLVRRWIEQDAPYARHWSFVPPERPRLPAASDPNWAKNPVDLFVLQELDQQQLTPSPAANRYELIRRLSLDLRGLPPTIAEVEEFISDDSPNAYERLATRFLDDPAYGERWARVWLDLARYADSRGYGSDPLRPNMWRYRDWVIDAFNRNLAYDQFTIEQLAGDLLPEPTIEQRMATAFHRNTMTNTEGGTDDEEFRVAAVKDRIETTLQVWMGLTMKCANCHDHKYDPIKQDEYYRFYAIFNQTADVDLPNEAPTIEAPTAEVLAAHRRIDAQLAGLRDQIDGVEDELAAHRQRTPSTPQTGQFLRIELPGKDKVLSLAEVQVWYGDKNLAAGGQATQSSTAHDGGPELAIDGRTSGQFFEAKSTTHTKAETDPWWELNLGQPKAIERVVVWNRTDNNLQKRLTGFRISLLDADRKPVWQQQVDEPPQPSSDFVLGPPSPLEKDLKELRDRVAKLEKSKPAVPTLPIMQELPADKQRTTYFMRKGNFLDKGPEVEPALPAVFQTNRGIPPRNRLGAAEWIVAGDNPLTARVAMNRLWAHLFGIGLVETEEDFGTQGESPSHPQLLDWLATEFVHTDWDVKRMLYLVVTSSTYRQSARVSPELYQRDPRNRLLARGPRFRLEAETVRDQALALSGLLSRKLNGPSVYPYQPKGLWRAAFNGQRTWPLSKGQDKYRRGLYTFWRRTIPYPSMETFDAPSREICSVRRIRTNTPLQAFVTLNDPVYVEAAQALARRIVREGGRSVDQRARFGLRLCLSRPASSGHLEYLQSLFASEFAYYRGHSAAAKLIATDPLGPAPDGSDLAELAAWTVVANVLLNLDAVLTKG